ncbi:MAG: hypothetical protein Fur006_51260 [Coleofasciculaceae cyanobacterium]
MKLSFCPISSFGDLVLVTTVASIALCHPVQALAKTKITFQVNYPAGRVSQASLAQKDIFQQLRQREIEQKKPDTPPPIPGSPGGSR